MRITININVYICINNTLWKFNMFADLKNKFISRIRTTSLE